MVNIENVTVTFQTKEASFKAVDAINLQIQEGEIFGIVGTSGAGKSTLIRTINLLQKPTSGKIWIAGEDITEYTGLKLRTIRHTIGMIFQHFNLIHTKTVFDNVAFPMVIAGASKEAILQRVPALLELVGLSDKMHVYPSTLSGGQKQRVGIARSLANNPRILLCDEPTSALDLETTNAILDLLKEINKKLGITTILITHEMDVIKKICNKVAVMDKGVVVETGSVYDIFSLPKHPFTQKLVAHTLNLELPSRILQDVQGRLIKVVYNGDRAEEPILSDAIRTFGVDINVLHGKIEYIDEKPLGVLLLNINASSAQIEQIISYLKERTASVEVFHG
ncbi:ATP-binding cassette domain-containing protein [Sulfurospirillum diekertiae]|uniref:Cell division ATP-binding protein FtsE n=1 Tax=Sulfurospirillum diekertiae TaxID=1854492 RepID=A0A6G9VTW5_9BACT|nr:ATP-binding cassette domain-containing protein [Sulfurospirillum diekertiae]QIR76371.1 ATP-binding cassette domain-containing protein [Sulfurospirillum diekertiae]QIR78996.1 ATP-binding cassette domain-containing protein [Sulfurospirillum diekertiae]